MDVWMVADEADQADRRQIKRSAVQKKKETANRRVVPPIRLIRSIRYDPVKPRQSGPPERP
jgi:hypothetical protein